MSTLIVEIGRAEYSNPETRAPYAKPRYPVIVRGVGDLGLLSDPEHEGCRKLLEAGFPPDGCIEMRGT